MSKTLKSRPESRRRPEHSRDTILQAAIREFAMQGMAGARTDAIARAARVNKALLYYYYKDKETLYGAALDHTFSQMGEHLMQVLDLPLAPREKVLAYVGAYFDFVASHPQNRNLIQMEIMRAGHGSPHLQRIAKRYFQPLYLRIGRVLQEGISSGDFRPVNPRQFVPSIVALVVFYFISAPVLEVVTGSNPLSPARIAERRAAVLDLISAGLFPPASRKAQGVRL